MLPRRESSMLEDKENKFYWECQDDVASMIEIDPDSLLAEIKAESAGVSPREEVYFEAANVMQNEFLPKDEFFPEENLMNNPPPPEKAAFQDGSVSPFGSAIDNTSEIVIDDKTCFIDENSVELLSDGEMEDPLAISDNEIEILSNIVVSIDEPQENQHSRTVRVRSLTDLCGKKTLNPSDTLSCPHCQKEFSHSRLLIHHLKTHAQKVQCPDCPKRFLSKQTLEAHQKCRHSDSSHAQIKHYRCHLCPRRYKHKHSLLQHLKSQHWEVSQQIPEHPMHKKDSTIDLVSNTSVSIKLSSVNSDPDSENSRLKAQCSFCLEEFPSYYDLMTHLTTVHADLHFAQNLSKFEQRCCLVNRNCGSTEDEPLYRCEICFAQFYDRNALVEHSTLHSSNGPVSVRGEDLSPSFVDSLRFNCEICGAQFCDRSELVEHAVHCTPTTFETTHEQWIPTVIQEQEERCPSITVDDSMSGLVLSSNNVQLQPSSPSLQCTFCPRIFRRRGNLTVHLKKMHSDLLDVSSEKNDKKQVRRKMKDQNSADSVVTPAEVPPKPFIITLDEDSMDSSVLNQNSITPYHCQFCQSKFYLRSNLMRHLIASHSKKQQSTPLFQNSSSEIADFAVHCVPAIEVIESRPPALSTNETPENNVSEFNELTRHQLIPTTLQTQKQCPSTDIPKTPDPMLSKLHSIKETEAVLQTQDTYQKSDIPSADESNVLSPPIFSDLNELYSEHNSNTEKTYRFTDCMEKLSDVPSTLKSFVNLASIEYPKDGKLYRCEYCFAKFIILSDFMSHLVTRHPDEYVDPFMLKPGKLLLRVQ